MSDADWPMVLKLFGNNGACGGCWCMWWRVEKHGMSWDEKKGEPNRRSLKKLVEAGEVHAVLAFAGDEAVGWCSFGPRSSFPFLVKSRALSREAPNGTWSIVCFYIPARWRGRGVATLLTDVATTRAIELGATEVEAFPVVPKSDGKVPAAFAWTGVPALFENAGYNRLPRDSALRPIFIKSARPRSGRPGRR